MQPFWFHNKKPFGWGRGVVHRHLINVGKGNIEKDGMGTI